MEMGAKLKREAEAQGTTTLETKSGYGLTVRTSRDVSMLPRRSPRRSLF